MKPDLSPIYVTRPFMPSLEDFLPSLRTIWQSRTLTNMGPFHNRLETALRDYLGVEQLSLFSSGTTALLCAIKALGITGEVITTPFTFVATANVLRWSGLDPVFVDIDPQTYNLDPRRIEAAITPRTSAIMPVHCYGTPCATAAIAEIARSRGLKVIYDAAHAFDVQDDAGSVLRHGDLSVLSFHATKTFHTFEGGAVISPDSGVKGLLDRLRNFGVVDEVSVTEIGINGKLNELAAAFGLLHLEHMTTTREHRAALDRRYRVALEAIEGIYFPPLPDKAAANYGYFPVLIEPSYTLSRDRLCKKLREAGIHARRYFYPLVSDFRMYSREPSASPANLPVARSIADKVLCLPIYADLSHDQQDRVIEQIHDGCRASRRGQRF